MSDLNDDSPRDDRDEFTAGPIFSRRVGVGTLWQYGIPLAGAALALLIAGLIFYFAGPRMSRERMAAVGFLAGAALCVAFCVYEFRTTARWVCVSDAGLLWADASGSEHAGRWEDVTGVVRRELTLNFLNAACECVVSFRDGRRCKVDGTFGRFGEYCDTVRTVALERQGTDPSRTGSPTLDAVVRLLEPAGSRRCGCRTSPTGGPRRRPPRRRSGR